MSYIAWEGASEICPPSQFTSTTDLQLHISREGELRDERIDKHRKFLMLRLRSKADRTPGRTRALLIIDDSVYILGDSMKNLGHTLSAILKTSFSPDRILGNVIL